MKKPTVIAVLCHKGGVAKTSTTTALADALVQHEPKARVLILDCDEQANIKTIFAVKLSEAEGGVASILLENTDPARVRVSVRPNIDVILSGGRMMRDFEKTHLNTPDNELILKRRMERVGSEYDYVLIDSPPALSLVSSNIAMYADFCVIPCTADLLAVVGVRSTLFFLENLEIYFKDRGIAPCGVVGVVPTMYDQRRILDMTILDDIQRMSNADLMRGGVVFDPIRSDTKVKTAQVRRKLLSEAFPASKAFADYQKLCIDMLARIDELRNGKIAKLKARSATKALQTPLRTPEATV
jgi:chromosome partitioning protein